MAVEIEESGFYHAFGYHRLPDEIHVYSDVTGSELEEDEIYDFEGIICGYTELLELLEVVEKVNEGEDFECDECYHIVKTGETYYVVNEERICEDCLNEIVKDYKTDVDDLLD